MRNITIREFIEVLRAMNQDAIVCRFDSYESTYSTIETCCEQNNVAYVDDDGNDVTGDIVSIY